MNFGAAYKIQFNFEIFIIFGNHFLVLKKSNSKKKFGNRRFPRSNNFRNSLRNFGPVGIRFTNRFSLKKCENYIFGRKNNLYNK